MSKTQDTNKRAKPFGAECAPLYRNKGHANVVEYVGRFGLVPVPRPLLCQPPLPRADDPLAQRRRHSVVERLKAERALHCLQKRQAVVLLTRLRLARVHRRHLIKIKGGWRGSGGGQEGVTGWNQNY
eukprot:420346-Prorocentrum_minimum.AAC.1